MKKLMCLLLLVSLLGCKVAQNRSAGHPGSERPAVQAPAANNPLSQTAAGGPGQAAPYAAATVLGFVDITALGCKPNNTTIDNAAIINAYTKDKDFVSLYIPPGVWNCKSTINIINRVVNIKGAGTAGSVLMFDEGIDGIFVTRTKNAPGPMGEGLLEGFAVQAKGKTPIVPGQSEYDAKGVPRRWHRQGIQIWQRYQLRDIRIYGFSNRGLEIWGSLVANGHDGNLVKATNVRIASCGGDGVMIVGEDANAGWFIGIDVVDCGGWGINDRSFLGNTWIACHTNNNKAGAYRTEFVTARSVFEGCYSEEGGKPSVFASKEVKVVGGMHGAGVVGGTRL